MEIGDGQQEAVAALFEAVGACCAVSFRKDYAGLDRVVSACRI
jgi:methylase of polypeptide subunit release factors